MSAPATARRQPSELRSARWFGPADLRSFGHRSRAMQMGYAPEEWTGRPVIAILNTWSDLQPCHMHFKARVDDVKRGVLMAGGFPVELPALSVSESYVKPTSMLYRNMLAMEAEELLRSHPVDGAVLMGGCDKTTPALLLGATSMDLPAIFVPAGPMLRGHWQGKVLGSGSDSWKYWDELRAGTITPEDWLGVERGIARSYGTCMTMGTASTMTAIAEALGMVLPGGSSIPAADAGHIRLASESGRRIVDMVWEDLRPSRIQTEPAFNNAIAVAMAMGCSTQRHHPPHRHGAPRRPRRRPRRLRALQPHRPGHRQRAPERLAPPDGGFLLRRRQPRPDGNHARAPPPRLPDGDGAQPRRQHRRRARLRRRT